MISPIQITLRDIHYDVTGRLSPVEASSLILTNKNAQVVPIDEATVSFSVTSRLIYNTRLVLVKKNTNMILQDILMHNYY